MSRKSKRGYLEEEQHVLLTLASKVLGRARRCIQKGVQGAVVVKAMPK